MLTNTLIQVTSNAKHTMLIILLPITEPAICIANSEFWRVVFITSAVVGMVVVIMAWMYIIRKINVAVCQVGKFFFFCSSAFFFQWDYVLSFVFAVTKGIAKRRA